jgi:hypothetical protein
VLTAAGSLTSAQSQNGFVAVSATTLVPGSLYGDVGSTSTSETDEDDDSWTWKSSGLLCDTGNGCNVISLIAIGFITISISATVLYVLYKKAHSDVERNRKAKAEISNGRSEKGSSNDGSVKGSSQGPVRRRGRIMDPLTREENRALLVP